MLVEEIQKVRPALIQDQMENLQQEKKRQLTLVIVALTVDKQKLQVAEGQEKIEIVTNEIDKKELAIRFCPGAVISSGEVLPDNMDVVVLLRDGLTQFLSEQNLPILKNYL